MTRDGHTGQAVAAHEALVVRHYDELDDVYQGIYQGRDIHSALFDPGQAPDEVGIFSGPDWRDAIMEGRRRYTDEVTEPAGITAADHLVDAGCGFGSTAAYLARRYGCRATGVNINRRQLDFAAQQAAATDPAGRVSYRWADCTQHLPFEDGSIDVVINIESACYYSDRDRFLRETARVLKPGGRFVTADFMTPDAIGKADYGRYIEPICEAWALHSLESPASYRRKIAAAGLEMVEFAGFGGREDINIRIAERGHARTAKQLLFGPESPRLRQMHAMFRTFAPAWRRGAVVLMRFLARKP